MNTRLPPCELHSPRMRDPSLWIRAGLVRTWASPFLHAVVEATQANAVCGVVPISLPEGELGCGGISTHWEEETRRKADGLVAAAEVKHLPQLLVRVAPAQPGQEAMGKMRTVTALG